VRGGCGLSANAPRPRQAGPKADAARERQQIRALPPKAETI